jgi:hypothetical protein
MNPNCGTVRESENRINLLFGAQRCSRSLKRESDRNEPNLGSTLSGSIDPAPTFTPWALFCMKSWLSHALLMDLPAGRAFLAS